MAIGKARLPIVATTPPFPHVAAARDLLLMGGIAEIRAYERALGRRFLDRLPGAVTVYGLPGLDGRVPTFLVNVEGVPATEVAGRLAERGFGVWAHDSWYSLDLYPRLGYEDGAVRIGIAHYNTADEVDRLVAELEALAP